MRQKKQPIRAGFFGSTRNVLCKLDAISAARDDRYIAGYVLGGLCNFTHFFRRKGKELTGAASRKKGCGIEAGKPGYVLAVAGEVQSEITVEMRDRK
jgi:predicted hotdog family 3-hydroxylacyl-ACP dehydratase